MFTCSEPKVNPIPYIGCCAGKVALDNSLYWINFVREEPPASPILWNFHYSALDLCYTFLWSRISVSVLIFLMNNPQSIFGVLSSRHSTLFHPPQALSVGSRDVESCSEVMGLFKRCAAAPSRTASQGKELPSSKRLIIDMGSGTVNTQVTYHQLSWWSCFSHFYLHLEVMCFSWTLKKCTLLGWHFQN